MTLNDPNSNLNQAPQQAYGGVTPVGQQDAYTHADAKYDKGARRGGGWRFLFFTALIVLIGALGVIGYIAFTYWEGQNEYDELTEYMDVGESGEGIVSLASFDVDWDALRAINSDIVGWVYVPGTIINYPIVWKENDDSYYLTHTFGGNTQGSFGAELGCIMLSGINSPKWTDEVNIIYGHHMRNGSMFALFADFINSEEFNQYRTVYVLTPEGNFRMTSFACDKVLGTSTDIAIPNFATKEELAAYVQARYDTSTVVPDPPGPDAASVQQVFAFSTCSEPDNQYRIITFCSVDEFLPAGASVSKGNALIDSAAVDAVSSGIAERIGQ